jgi:hypothetical protein
MRSHILLTGILVALFATVAPAPLHAQNQAAVDSAKQAAQEWLVLLDADSLEATWREGASFFKSKIGADQWAQRIRTAHRSLGPLRSRSLVAARYTASLPNAPAGEYVIAQYRASYGGQSFVETVSLKKEQDEWRVAGYFIRPNNQ